MKKYYAGWTLVVLTLLLVGAIRQKSSTFQDSINFKTQTVATTTIGSNLYASVCANFPMMSANVCNKLAQVYISSFGTNPLYITTYCLPFSNWLPAQTCQDFITQVIAFVNWNNSGNFWTGGNGTGNNNQNNPNNNTNLWGSPNVPTANPNNPLNAICINFPTVGMIRCYGIINAYVATYGQNSSQIATFCAWLPPSTAATQCPAILNAYFNVTNNNPNINTNAWTGGNGTGNNGTGNNWNMWTGNTGTWNTGNNGGNQVAFMGCDTIAGIPTSECEWLVSIYKTTRGETWTNNAGWIQTNTPCSWYGVTCTNDHVTSVSLANNKLMGWLHEYISKLSLLLTLDISWNEICWTLPESMAQAWPVGSVPTITLTNNKLITDPASYSDAMQSRITQNITRGTQNSSTCS